MTRNVLSPLVRHRIGDPSVGHTPELPSVLGRAELVLSAICLVRPAWLAVDDPRVHMQCWPQQWQPLEPQACGLAGVVAELVRMDDLIGFPVRCSDATDGIFQCDHRNRVVHESLAHQVEDEDHGIPRFLLTPWPSLVPMQAG